MLRSVDSQQDREAISQKGKRDCAGLRFPIYLPEIAHPHSYPPGVTSEQLFDAALPIVVVEGEKKALALQRLAWHEVETPRFIPIVISGVWNWRGTVGKAGGPRGERVDVKGPINDLNRISFPERTVFILFDANVATNDSVK